jgi:hypothetical protein
MSRPVPQTHLPSIRVSPRSVIPIVIRESKALLTIYVFSERTKGKHSLDDFLRSFFGQHDTDAMVAPYTREDVEASLAALCPYHWHSFFEEKSTRPMLSLRPTALRQRTTARQDTNAIEFPIATILFSAMFTKY